MITITIATDNDAFRHREWGELADILRKVAERAHRGDSGKVVDSNGNTVGEWVWSVGDQVAEDE